MPPAWDELTSDQQRRVATSAAEFPEPPAKLLAMAVAGWHGGNSLAGAPRTWEYVLRIEPLARAVESSRRSAAKAAPFVEDADPEDQLTDLAERERIVREGRERVEEAIRRAREARVVRARRGGEVAAG